MMKSAQNGEAHRIENDPGSIGDGDGSGVTDLPARVLIVGGSNSVRYTPHVEMQLKGIAQVERVPDNARSTRYTLERLEGWLGSRNWHIIHFNWGMHDLTRVDGAPPQVPLDEYERNLDSLVPRLQRAADRLIWATTMSMLPEHQPRRRLEDILEYNRVAGKVMARCQVPVQDLFTFTATRPELFGEDGLHFTDEGYRTLGEVIGEAIKEAIRGAPR